ncbi:MAG: Ni/Fe-hydrogenase, b-type cytochrome subunit [Corynebacterium sp.]|uniref:Ni/Fe-hydrogenase, b-type cytochrome subunit n=1 Tax=Corynebacterium sp. TaxID=1720 RepID=UPI0026DA81F6|nr:Ni/Fe-hydrogenase, b-type cytochrome subunit [Corynebacterium sp.]MDO5097623.1 Ni/Fe-hydrogenase, b-type cytochrome subunit [Corynebacterium sp.]
MTSTQPASAQQPFSQVDHTRMKTVLNVAASIPVADVGSETLIRLAGVSPAGSNDPVDHALYRAIGEVPAAEYFDYATQDRRFSIAHVKGVEFGGEVHDLAVMRGDITSVLEAADADPGVKSLALRNANVMRKLGRRSLGVAIAPLVGDTAGDFKFQGLVALSVGGQKRIRAHTRGGYTRIQMWPRALRIQHWLNMLLIIALSVTGYYIMNPFFGAELSQDTGYLMGIIRYIHFVSGFAWIAVAAWRLSLTVFATQKHMRWRSLWPIYGKDDVKKMWATVQYYLFLKEEGPHYVGHNVLQQLTYSTIYALCTIQILSGLALYGLYDQYNLVWQFFSFPIHIIGVPMIRMIHTVIMFLLFAFVILHVYLVFRADSIENHGGVSAMINGGVWLPTGSKPVDAPEIE